MSKPYVCPKCDGWKQVQRPQEITTTTPVYETCPVCNGVGVLWSIDPPAPTSFPGTGSVGGIPAPPMGAITPSSFSQYCEEVQ